MNQREYLADLAYVHSGQWPAIADAIRRKQQPYHCMKHENYITIADEEYPECLRKLRFPPWVLFYQGDISLLKQPMITIVGSRDLCEYGRQMSEMTASILQEKYVIVSGLARGVDAVVAQTTLALGGKTIAVIGSGLGTHYPYENENLYQKIGEKGLILSEYPFPTGVRKHHFPWRNRILAGLGESLIVTQAQEHSGTMITVNEALNLSKDVYCIPYPMDDIHGSGCNRLIEEGAGIIYSKAQLLDLIE